MTKIRRNRFAGVSVEDSGKQDFFVHPALVTEFKHALQICRQQVEKRLQPLQV
jgi:hypothetical protein